MTESSGLPPALRVRMLDTARRLFETSAARSRASGDPVASAAHALLTAYWLACGEQPPEGCSAAALARELSRTVDLLANTALVPSLVDGYVAATWMANTASTVGLRSPGALGLEAIDEVLDDDLAALQADGMYDYLYGVAGALWYELHVPAGPRPAVVARRLAMLSAMARPAESGIGWWTPRERVRRPTSEAGYFDLGFAHGQAGVIAVLSRAASDLPGLASARPLLERAVAAYDVMLAAHPGHVVPHASIAGQGESRHGWCYGTPGVAIAMFEAARALGDDVRRDSWARRLTRALEDPPSTARIDSAGFCHGSAGLAHIARQAAAHGVARDAAVPWLERTVELVAQDRRDPDASPLLEGEVGIALVLLSAATDCGARWAQLLAADLAPTPR